MAIYSLIYRQKNLLDICTHVKKANCFVIYSHKNPQERNINIILILLSTKTLMNVLTNKVSYRVTSHTKNGSNKHVKTGRKK